MPPGYESFFGLFERPFSLTPDARYHFRSRAHARALAGLSAGSGATCAYPAADRRPRHRQVHALPDPGAHLSAHHARCLTSPMACCRPRNSIGGCCKTWAAVGADDDEHRRLAQADRTELAVKVADALRDGTGPAPFVMIDEAHLLPPVTADHIISLASLDRAGRPLLQVLPASQPPSRRSATLPQRRGGIGAAPRPSHAARPRRVREPTSAPAELPAPLPLPSHPGRRRWLCAAGAPRLVNLLCERAMQEAAAWDSTRSSLDVRESRIIARSAAQPIPKRFRWYGDQDAPRTITPAACSIAPPRSKPFSGRSQLRSVGRIPRPRHVSDPASTRGPPRTPRPSGGFARARVDQPWDKVLEWKPPRREVVRRRQAQRQRQLPRPPRPHRAPQQGRVHLGRRARRPPDADLLRSLPPGLPVRQRAEVARRRRRAIASRSTCRSSPSWRSRCWRARASAPCTRVVFGGFSAESLRDRINDSQASVLVTADGGYRRGADRAAQADGRRSARRTRRRSSTSSSCGARLRRHPGAHAGRPRPLVPRADAGRAVRLRARADGRRGHALHPLHVRHDRKAEGHRPHHGRLSDSASTRRRSGCSISRTRTSTGARPTSAGSPATATSSTGRSPTARRW